MKLLPLAIAASLLAGCQVTPNTGDTTNAMLKFRIHYQSPVLASPQVELTTSTSIDANTCVFVAPTFGVAANAADPEGIRSIVIGPSGLFDAVTVRQMPGDTVALPSPSSPTQGPPNMPIPNPGTPADSAMVMATYAQGKAFDTVNLLGVYQFAPGHTLGALRATVHNFGTTTGVSEVYNFYVRPASNKANEQPGMNCPMP